MDDTIVVSLGDMVVVDAWKVRSDCGMYLDFRVPVCWFSAKSISAGIFALCEYMEVEQYLKSLFYCSSNLMALVFSLFSSVLSLLGLVSASCLLPVTCYLFHSMRLLRTINNK